MYVTGVVGGVSDLTKYFYICIFLISINPSMSVRPLENIDLRYFLI